MSGAHVRIAHPDAAMVARADSCRGAAPFDGMPAHTMAPPPLDVSGATICDLSPGHGLVTSHSATGEGTLPVPKDLSSSRSSIDAMRAQGAMPMLARAAPPSRLSSKEAYSGFGSRGWAVDARGGSVSAGRGPNPRGLATALQPAMEKAPHAEGMHSRFSRPGAWDTSGSEPMASAAPSSSPQSAAAGQPAEAVLHASVDFKNYWPGPAGPAQGRPGQAHPTMYAYSPPQMHMVPAPMQGFWHPHGGQAPGMMQYHPGHPSPGPTGHGFGGPRVFGMPCADGAGHPYAMYALPPSAVSTMHGLWGAPTAPQTAHWGISSGLGAAPGLETMAAAAGAAVRPSVSSQSFGSKPDTAATSFPVTQAPAPLSDARQAQYNGMMMMAGVAGWPQVQPAALPGSTVPRSAAAQAPASHPRPPAPRASRSGEFDLDACGPFRCGCVRGKPELGAPAAVAAAQLTPHSLLRDGSIAPCTDYRGSVVCNETFADVAALTAHREEAHGVEPPPGVCCPLCFREVSCRSHLNRHMRGCHTREHRWSCDECGKSFSSLSNRDAHVRSVHRKTRPFVCRACPRSFSRRTHLRVHCRKVHGVDIGTRTHLVTWADIHRLAGHADPTCAEQEADSEDGGKGHTGAAIAEHDDDRRSSNVTPTEEPSHMLTSKPDLHQGADSAEAPPFGSTAHHAYGAVTPVIASASPCHTGNVGSAAVSEAGDTDAPHRAEVAPAS